MSTLTAQNLSDGPKSVPMRYALSGSAKVWVATNMSSGSPVSEGSLNVESLTDMGVGRLRVSLSSAMASASYASTVSSNKFTDPNTWSTGFEAVHTKLSTSYEVGVNRSTGPIDAAVMDTSIFGDLA